MTDNTTDQASGLRVLLIDDDVALVRLARLVLHSQGFDVKTARDGVEGLHELETDAFDVVVLDLHMPRMDGPTFFREMRGRGYTEPVLILSANEAERARRELHAEGSVGKPFDPDDLVREVQRVSSSR